MSHYEHFVYVCELPGKVTDFERSVLRDQFIALNYFKTDNLLKFSPICCRTYDTLKKGFMRVLVYKL